MFVSQNNHMTRLLQKYGNEMCLLDATYKRTHFALPFFFLLTKTNVFCKIVTAFLIEGATGENITAVLTKIKEWNRDFNPLYAMVDYCADEINALETLYPDKISIAIIPLKLKHWPELWSHQFDLYIFETILFC